MKISYELTEDDIKVAIEEYLRGFAHGISGEPDSFDIKFDVKVFEGSDEEMPDVKVITCRATVEED